MEEIREHLLDNIISLLFTILGCEIIFYSIYRKFNIIYSIIIPVLVLVLYIIFKRVVDLEKKGVLLYLAVGILIMGSVYILVSISSSTSKVTFFQWVFGGGSRVGEYFGYALGGVILISFVFSSLAYYFSINIVRMPMLFLLSFIVLAAYVKGAYAGSKSILTVFIFIFLYLLFSLFIQNTKVKDISKEMEIRTERNHLLSIGLVFVGVTLLVAFVIPKPIHLPNVPMLDGMKSLVNNYMVESELSDAFSVKDNSTRETDKSTTQNSNKVLYKVKGEDVRYLIDHNFDTYINGVWKKDSEKFKYGYNIVGKSSSEIERNIRYLKEAYQVNPEKYKGIVTNDDVNFRRTAYINSTEDNVNVIAHQPNMIYINSADNDKQKVYLNEYDQVFTDRKEGIKSNEYVEMIYNSDVPAYNSTEYNYLRYLNKDRYEELLRDIEEDIEDYRDDDYLDNYLQLEGSTTDRMKELSKSLTKNKISTFDKAKSIEDYFQGNDFEYNLDLPTNKGKSSYVDFFIFEGKKGYCVQYATAMTLLCRASGIPARYVEGYSTSDDDIRNGEYEIKASSGHAFVQIYIEGYGWKIFDPTPGASIIQTEEINDETKGSGTSNTFLDRKYLLPIIVVISSIALVTGIIILILYLTKRKRFLKKLWKKSSGEILEGLIRNSVELLSKEDFIPNLGETELNFAKRVDSQLNLGIYKIMESYYGYKYGFEPIDNKVLEEASRINKEIYEYLKKK